MPFWGGFWGVRLAPGASFGRFWGQRGSILVHLGCSWALLGHSWAPLWRFWGAKGEPKGSPNATKTVAGVMMTFGVRQMVSQRPFVSIWGRFWMGCGRFWEVDNKKLERVNNPPYIWKGRGRLGRKIRGSIIRLIFGSTNSYEGKGRTVTRVRVEQLRG